MRKRIKKGKFVDVFTLTEETKKEFKKAGEAVVEALRLRCFLVFATCYLET